ncbi:hypothetical protein Drorol1_Dr00004764 [Drosera rotundifolia]
MSRIFVKGEKKERIDPSQLPRPKLVRRNAAKNFEYIPSPSPSSSPSHSTSSRRSGFGRQARSLDIPHSGSQTSFRLDGSDGELDMMYESLGLLGPDDFEIPRDMWELMKSRSSSDVIKRPELSFFESEDPEEPRIQNVDAVGDELSDGFNERVQINESTMPPNRSSETAPCNGIRGDRPPLLTPPPAMSLPVLDNGCSTWDLINSLAPDTEESILGGTPMIHYSDDDDEEADAAGDNEEKDGVDGIRLGETVVLSGSSSFTSHDDDASSSTTDPVSVISPNGTVRANITYWEKGDLLGQGSFGKVYKAISSEGFFFAVKEVSLTEQGTQGRQSVLQLEQEIDLLSQFEHENIVRYLGTDKDDSSLYIFLELITQGSLVSLYKRYNLRDSQVSAYTRQILYGLQYLHDRRVVHRDIKCANILVAANGTVKLADFGLAKATKLNDLKSCKGTPFWMAPEVVNQKNKGYGHLADIWSVGCTVLEMLTRLVPYHPLEHMTALYRIGRGIPPPIPPSLSREARDFIMLCLQANPSDRPSAADLLHHPFVRRPLPTGSESPLFPGRWVSS